MVKTKVSHTFLIIICRPMPINHFLQSEMFTICFSIRTLLTQNFNLRTIL